MFYPFEDFAIGLCFSLARCSLCCHLSLCLKKVVYFFCMFYDDNAAGLLQGFRFFLYRYLSFIVRVSIVEFVEMKLVSISICTQNPFILSTIMAYR